jgi:hypothetical protein
MPFDSHGKPHPDNLAGLGEHPIPRCAAREGFAASDPPRVLVAVSVDWFFAARIAEDFANAGFHVEAICPSTNVLSALSSVKAHHAFRGLAPLRALSRAIVDGRPDLIVPCDDRVVAQLQHLYEASSADDPRSQLLRSTIVRSLGAAESFPITRSRSAFIQTARSLDLAAAETSRVADRKVLHHWLVEHGLPAVLKTDGSWGGLGAAVADTPEDALKALALLSAPRLLRALKRLVVNHDRGILDNLLRSPRPAVNIQSYVRGRPANVAVACWRGEVLATVAVEAVCTDGELGASTVVRTIQNDEINHAAERIVKHLNLSGLCGFDFIIDADQGLAHLIEFNPRATPTYHLNTGGAGSPFTALAERVGGKGVEPSPQFPPGALVALFPGELARDPDSAYLQSAHHDVPWHSSQLASLGFKFSRRKHRAGSIRIEMRSRPARATS